MRQKQTQKDQVSQEEKKTKAEIPEFQTRRGKLHDNARTLTCRRWRRSLESRVLRRMLVNLAEAELEYLG